MSEYLVKVSDEPSPSDKVRESNIELFRIVSMFLIVAHHLVVNSGLTAADGPVYSDPQQACSQRFLQSFQRGFEILNLLFFYGFGVYYCRFSFQKN